jgi:dephospho-CoA kinase
MKILAISGGIGTGKSYISKILRKKDIPVYDSDMKAKSLMQKNPIKKELLKEFGEETYKNDNLNTNFLSNIVFNNKEKLNILNKIVHKEVLKDFNKWKLKQNKEIVGFETAILDKLENINVFDYILVVDTPKELRIERIKKRDNISEEEIIKRFENQNHKKLLDMSDFIINNNNENLEKQIKDILWKIKNYKN